MKCKNVKTASNQSGIYKAPKPIKDSPKAETIKGKDLRTGKK